MMMPARRGTRATRWPWLLGAAALAAPFGRASAQAPACPVLPQFEALRRSIERAPAAEALRRLEAYFADPTNENPAACESFEIDRLMGERERALVTLVVPTRPPIHPDAAYRCDRVDPLTTRCDGVVADDTGHSDGMRGAASLGGRFVGRIEGALPGARLIGLYRARLGDDFERRPATRLAMRPPIAMTVKPGDVLIALFAAARPFRIRKLVWYF